MSRKDTLIRKNPPTIIASDMHLLGNIISDGALDIDGNIEGNVTCKSIVIRRHGIILGDVIADSVHVYGTVRGLIRAHEVNLYATCKVEGVIMHASLTIEDGAFVDGQFKRIDQFSGTTQSDDSDEEYEVFRNLKLIS